MRTIDIYRNTDGVETLLKTIKPDDSSAQVRKVMAENQLNLTFEMNEFVQFQINDYCSVFGEIYQLYELPVITKLGIYSFKYSMTMSSQIFLLNNYQYLFYDNTNQLRESDFSLMGNAETFLDLLITNANRVGLGWTKGEVLTTDYKVLDFSKESCYNALVRISEEFDTEFTIIGKTVHLIKRQYDSGKIFKVGKNKGLYEITRTNIDTNSLITRLYAYGSEKNLPPNYFSNRLRYPGTADPCLVTKLIVQRTENVDLTLTFGFEFNASPGADVTSLDIQYRTAGSTDPWTSNIGANESPRQVNTAAGSYEFRFVTIAAGSCDGVTSPVIVVPDSILVPIWENPPIPYIEKNTNSFGIIEHTEIFDDIYPTRTSKVTSVNVADIYKLTDTSIDFNLNNYLLPGISPKIVFNTGQLAGYEFEISSYNHGTKEIRILKNKDERVLDLPNSLLKPAIGDEYVLIDIRLPHRYVYEAEQRLKAKAEELINTLSIPQVSYQVVFDPVYIRVNQVKLNPNDLVWIVDSQLNIEKQIRILSVTRSIVNEDDVKVQLSDTAEPTTLSRVINSISANNRNVTAVQSQMINRSVFNNNIIGDLKVLQGTVIIESIPETSTLAGFLPIYIEVATGKIYAKI